MKQRVRTRLGGHVLVESLEALGAEVVFGLPGIHVLAIWEGLRTSDIRCLGFRTELNAGFAADGYARVSGRPAPLLLSTGPGALNSLAALMEAASAHVPVVAIASQIPGDLIGRSRGYLHELPNQLASFEPIVKWAVRVTSPEGLPELLAEAWRRALTAPTGPVFLEIPVDVLTGPTEVPRIADLDTEPPVAAQPPPENLGEAARLLASARRPVLWAGGGVLRAGAWEEVATLAERLGAPVATTFMGKGAFPEDHPLAAGSGCDEAAFQQLLGDADVLLCVGTELGAETTGQYTLRFTGRLVQVDAAPERIGASYPALGLVGDAGATMRALIELIPARRDDGSGEARVRELRERIERGLDAQGHELEQGLLRTIRSALPREAVHAWDMTILSYWAAAHFPALAPRRFLYALGSGTLGYALPAALGAKAALGDTQALAVVGDGGFLYGLQELASAREHSLGAKLLLVDDGGYGILREYQRAAYGETYGVDLLEPDFAALCAAFGVPVRMSDPESVGADLAWALELEGPAAVVLRATLASASATS